MFSSTNGSDKRRKRKGRKRKNNVYTDEELASHQGRPKRSRGGARGQKETLMRRQEEERILAQQREQETLMRRQEQEFILALILAQQLDHETLMRRQEEERTLAQEREHEALMRRQEEDPRILARKERRQLRNRIRAQRTRDREKLFFKSLQKEGTDLQRENVMLKALVRNRHHVDIIDSLDAAATAAAAASVFDAVFEDFDFETNILEARNK